ncbi:ERF family protein [Bartonella sp. 220]|uniref:ERF family protein n=1 Tax=Bartonella sp. 220B TaxID=2967260 RepID=UPI0022A902B8|nr:ERF family protein [Bartonella sp. 220B]MCZ2158832.1 ERF family protein [Bartonella sp. 220B]
MNEQNTNLTEVEKTQHLDVEQTAMERILNKALESDVDMDRLERLLDLREKEIKRQNHQSFIHDLSAMQIEYQTITKNAKNNHTKSAYATLDQYIDAVKDTLAKHRFALFSHIKNQTEKNITIEITLSHPSGNQISTEGTFPIDGQGSKNNIQSLGSTITYARRYLLGMLLNVASKEDDKDGNMPEKSAFPEQINEIRRLMVQTKVEEEKILSYANVETLDDISDQSAQTILHLLKDKQNKQMVSTQQQTAV